MEFPAGISVEVEEFQRLKLLMPAEIQHYVRITSASSSKTSLIQIHRDGAERLAIEIDLKNWQKLEQSQRDLLFWHHVFRIQNHTLPSSNWESLVIKGGLLFSAAELIAQNLVAFAIALVLIGFSAHQLYQNNRGEQAVKVLTEADQGAIALALQRGYSWGQAHASMKAAIQYLASHATTRRQRQQQQVRLRVLEICARKRQVNQVCTAAEPVFREAVNHYYPAG